MHHHNGPQTCPYLKLQAIYHDYAGPLARKLMHELALSNDESLVTLLGHGFENNNLEALESWVYAVCMALKLPFHAKSFPTLESTLRAALEALRTQQDVAHVQEVHYAQHSAR